MGTHQGAVESGTAYYFSICIGEFNFNGDIYGFGIDIAGRNLQSAGFDYWLGGTNNAYSQNGGYNIIYNLSPNYAIVF